MALPFSLLDLRNFRLLFMAHMFVHMALQAMAVIVGWQIWQLTHSELLLGLVGLAEAVPAIFGAFVSGYAVDRSTPQRIYIRCLVSLGTIIFLLWMTAGEFIQMTDHWLTVVIFCGMFLSGIARSFLMPSYFSILPQIVERKDYSAASAWTNTATQIAVLAGPLSAGLAYGFMGPAAAWGLPFTYMAFGLLSIISIQHIRSYEKSAMSKSAWTEITAGWKFILKNRMILAVMAVDMFAVLFGGAVAMLPAYADKILHVGPQGLGLLRTAPSFGALLMALYFSVRPMKTFPLTRLLWAVAAFGICMIGFGISTSFWLSLLFLAFSGLFDTIGVVIRSTIKQILTPDHMRGRVGAINSIFVTSSNEIGAFESGIAASVMGLVPSVVFGGVMATIVAGTTFAITPKLRKKPFDHNSLAED